MRKDSTDKDLQIKQLRQENTKLKDLFSGQFVTCEFCGSFKRYGFGCVCGDKR